MINVAAHVAAHQSSKRRQQEPLQPPPPPPPPPPTSTPIPPLPPRPNPPIQQQYQQYPIQTSSQLPNAISPFSHLTDLTIDPSTISLQLTRTNPKNRSFQSATISTPTGEPLYTITYDPDSNYSGTISRSTFTAHWKQHTFRSKKLEFFLPWPNGKWGFDPAKRRWVSDVDLLPGHEFEWITMTNPTGYVLKCVDTSTGSDICRVVVEGGSVETARITIPLGIVVTWEQLDEVVTVAVAVDSKVFGEVVASAGGSSEAGSLKNTFEGINGILGAAAGSGGGGGSC